MHVVTRSETDDDRDRGGIEELALPPRLLAWLRDAASKANPHMPASLGMPDVIRILIERAEESGLDLARARCEADIVRLVTDAVQHGRNGLAASAPPSSSGCSGSRRSSRSSLPARGRSRSGKRPRSGRG